MLKVQGRPILARLLDDLAPLRLPRDQSCAATDAEAVRRGRRALRRQPRVRDDGRGATRWRWPRTCSRPARSSRSATSCSSGTSSQALLEEAGEGPHARRSTARCAGQDAPDRVRGDRADTGRFTFEPVRLGAIGDAVPPAESHGVWIGLLHVGARRRGVAARGHRRGARRRHAARARLTDLLARVLARGRHGPRRLHARRLGQRQQPRGPDRRVRDLTRRGAVSPFRRSSHA